MHWLDCAGSCQFPLHPPASLSLSISPGIVSDSVKPTCARRLRGTRLNLPRRRGGGAGAP
jgi:hypothetical protein